MSETSGKSPIIENPLQWQKEVDESSEPLNIRGSSRFWRTVESKLDNRMIIRDGAPEFFSMDIQLDDGIWLRLKGNKETGWIDYRFVSQAQVEQDHSWIEWHSEESEG